VAVRLFVAINVAAAYGPVLFRLTGWVDDLYNNDYITKNNVNMVAQRSQNLIHLLHIRLFFHLLSCKHSRAIISSNQSLCSMRHQETTLVRWMWHAAYWQNGLEKETRSSASALPGADGKRFHHQAELFSQPVANNRSLDYQPL